MIENLFEINKKGTSIKVELLAGLTTFLTMSYILFVNPSILSQTGMDHSSVFIATCLAAGLGTLLLGLLANLPMAQAPGMGLNAFFTYTVVFSMGYSWQQALALVFLSGILFLIFTVTGLRTAIINAIPKNLKLAIAPGIGLFIALIGLNNAGLIEVNQGPIINIISEAEVLDKSDLIGKIKNAPTQIIQFGKLSDPSVLLTAIGFFILTILMVRKISSAMIWSILITTIIGIPLGISVLPDSYDISKLSLSPTFFQMDFAGLFQSDDGSFAFNILLTTTTVIISFTLVDLLDTMGTLLGTASKGNLLDEEGNLPKMDKALFADASATTLGAVLGTSSVTTYIESSSGIIAGGRTGLSSVCTATLFVLGIFLAPIASVIPVAATSPVLIMVGILMFDGIRKINLTELSSTIPAVLLIMVMPFTYSIANGIAFGLLLYVLIQVATGKFKEVPIILYIIVALFMLKYVAL